MRSIITMVLALGMTTPLLGDTFVYVSMAPEQKIQIYRLDSTTGDLEIVEALAVEGTPGSLGVDPQKKLLFASLRSTNSLASFRLDPATGKLALQSNVELPKGENASYLSIDRTGALAPFRFLRGGQGGRAQDQCRRNDPLSFRADRGNGQDRSLHCHRSRPELRVRAARYSQCNHAVPVRHASGPTNEGGPGPGRRGSAGPRHLAFHPSLKLAFSSDESGSSITAYRFDPTKGLAPIQTLSTLPLDFKGQNSTAEVKVHPSGKFVWVSNRGHDSLAGFAIDEGGELSPLGTTPTEKTPRSFEIDPSGQFVFGAGEASGKLAVYRVEPDNGKLTRLRTYEVGKSLTWVLAVKPEK